MHDRTNTIAGWVLFGGIAALGLSIVTSSYFHGEEPETPGFAIEGGEEAGAADSGPSFTALLANADVAKGEAVFKKCTACHTINAGGANGIGPNLYGVVGKPHGAHPGFSFSAALKGVPGNWDFDALDAWLKSPKKYAPGTLMSFAGLSSAEDRANLVAYLNSQGSNLPLPAPPPPEAEAPAGDDAATGNEAAPDATTPTTEAPVPGTVTTQAATTND